MPKYYCDYCKYAKLQTSENPTNNKFDYVGDIFLTHDSPSVRKSHNEGWKHKAAVKNYYSQFEENQTQSLIDQKVKAFEQKAAGVGKYQSFISILKGFLIF